MPGKCGLPGNEKSPGPEVRELTSEPSSVNVQLPKGCIKKGSWY